MRRKKSSYLPIILLLYYEVQCTPAFCIMINVMYCNKQHRSLSHHITGFVFCLIECRSGFSQNAKP